MLFNSIHFLVFLPLVVLLFFALKHLHRRDLLLIASTYFYAVFSTKLLLLLFFASALDFYMASVIERNRARPTIMRLALVTSVVGNLAPLCVFKYLDFLNHSIAGLAGAPLWPILNLVLPMGISFYTFETISYTVDVYRGDIPAAKSFRDYLLFIMFFPHLVAGPILRARDILPQFREPQHPNADRILSGVQLVVWGLLKKIFVADPIGDIATSVYGAPDISAFSGLALLMATYAFAVQIYCDFSAYSDIAIGSARILGFTFPKNFDSPYLALGFSEFWRRWHISLSSWLRDYLYIPLGGNRISPGRTYVNLMVTMLLGGLWHGASWTFVVWGLLHGVYLAAERALGLDLRRSEEMGIGEKAIRGMVTFHLVALAWVFFRASSFAQAWNALGGILTWREGAHLSSAPLLVLVLLVSFQMLRQNIELEDLFLQVPMLSRWMLYTSLVVIVTALAGGRSPEFIYFQF